MSAAIETAARKPAAGDRVAALVNNKPATITLPDGCLVLTREELAVFGDGDPVKGGREIRLMIANERERTVSEAQSPRPSDVRFAVPRDADALMELIMMDVAENAAHVAPPNESRIRGFIDAAANRRQGVLAGVIDGPDGKPVAVVLLVPMQWFWSMSFYYQELVLFVHPDHRKSTHMRGLLAFQRWWVNEMTNSYGYRVYLLCGVLGFNRVRAKIALYRRTFRQVGAVFLYPFSFGKVN
jgi:hypothetical protein